MLALMVLMFLYLRYFKHGYEIYVMGESEATARYAGMNVPGSSCGPCSSPAASPV